MTVFTEKERELVRERLLLVRKDFERCLEYLSSENDLMAVLSYVQGEQELHEIQLEIRSIFHMLIGKVIKQGAKLEEEEEEEEKLRNLNDPNFKVS